MYYIVIMGPAGSGKSTLAKALADWLEDQELSVSIVNFDPAAESLPYTPDVDIRRYVRARDLMIEKRLGPNGALVASVDMTINYIAEIREEIDETRANYVIIDMPGQLEIVAFRRLGPQIIKELVKGVKSVSIFLLDARLASIPSSAFSLLLLSLSTLYRIQLPQILAVNKIDLVLSKEELSSVEDYVDKRIFLFKLLSDEYSCYEASETSLLLNTDVSVSICESLRQVYSNVIPISAKENVGMDYLYAEIQRAIAGGEDFLTEEPSGRL